MSTEKSGRDEVELIAFCGHLVLAKKKPCKKEPVAASCLQNNRAKERLGAVFLFVKL